MVAGDPGEERQEPDTSIGMTLVERVERLVQDEVFKDVSTPRAGAGSFSLVKMSWPDIFLSACPDLGLASLVFLLAAAWISLEEVKQMSPTLWNFSPFLTRLLVQICLSGPRVRLSLLRLGTRE